MGIPPGVISGEAARRFSAGPTELEVESDNSRRIVLELGSNIRR